MKSNSFFASLVAVALIITACSSSTDPADQPTVTMSTKVENNSVSAFNTSGKNSVSGGELQIRVDNVKVLLSRLKFHRSKSDDDTVGGETVKVGPFVVEFQSGETKAFFTSEIPAGTYTKVKFERHKFSSSELREYETKAGFEDFTTSDKNTLIIRGVVIVDGTETPFTYANNDTENFWIDFDDDATVENDDELELSLVFDASGAFKANGNVYNPLESSDIKEIGKNLKHALKVQN